MIEIEKIKEGMTVYVEVDGIPEQCVVMNKDFDGKGQTLLYYNTNNAVIAMPNEMFDTKEECEKAYVEEQKAAYQEASNEMSTLADLLAFLINKTSNRIPLSSMEMIAVMNHASEYTGINMLEYYKEYLAE